MTTLNLQVAAGADDAKETNADTGFASNGSQIVLQIGLTTADQTSGGFRFSGATIPVGATINSATLELYEDAGGSDPVNLDLFAEDVDNSNDFAGTADVINRTRTTATTNWNMVSASTSDWNTSPDIASLVQEVVNRAGWSSGNAISILAIAKSSLSTFTFTAAAKDGSANSAKLNIDYTAAPPAVFVFQCLMRIVSESDANPQIAAAEQRERGMAVFASRQSSNPIIFPTALFHITRSTEEEELHYEKPIAAILATVPTPPVFRLFRRFRPIVVEVDSNEWTSPPKLFFPLESTTISPVVFTLFRSRGHWEWSEENIDALWRIASTMFPFATVALCNDQAAAACRFRVSGPASCTFFPTSLDDYGSWPSTGASKFKVAGPASCKFYVSRC